MIKNIPQKLEFFAELSYLLTGLSLIKKFL